MAGISAIFIISMMLSICGEVFMRYLLKKPLMWTVEISEYLQMYVTFLAAAYVLRHDGHVKLEILTGILSPGTKKVFFMLRIYSVLLRYLLLCGFQDLLHLNSL